MVPRNKFYRLQAPSTELWIIPGRIFMADPDALCLANRLKLIQHSLSPALLGQALSPSPTPDISLFCSITWALAVPAPLPSSLTAPRQLAHPMTYNSPFSSFHSSACYHSENE